MQDLAAGRIDFLCEVITTAKPQIDGGTVNALAIFDTKRSPALPNLPTAEEQGTKDLDRLHLERGLPAEEHAGADRQAAQRGDRRGDAHAGGDASGCRRSAPRSRPTIRRRRQYLAKLVKDEIEKWAVPIKASGVTVD